MLLRPGQGRGWRKVGAKDRKGGREGGEREGEGSVPPLLFLQFNHCVNVGFGSVRLRFIDGIRYMSIPVRDVS